MSVPFSERPGWFLPVAVSWLLLGFPPLLIALFLWISGTPVTEAPPPPSGEAGDMLLSLTIRLVVGVWVFLTPVLLVLTEVSFRRRRRNFEGQRPHAQH